MVWLRVCDAWYVNFTASWFNLTTREMRDNHTGSFSKHILPQYIQYFCEYIIKFEIYRTIIYTLLNVHLIRNKMPFHSKYVSYIFSCTIINDIVDRYDYFIDNICPKLARKTYPHFMISSRTACPVIKPWLLYIRQRDIGVLLQCCSPA